MTNIYYLTISGIWEQRGWVVPAWVWQPGLCTSSLNIYPQNGARKVAGPPPMFVCPASSSFFLDSWEQAAPLSCVVPWASDNLSAYVHLQNGSTRASYPKAEHAWTGKSLTCEQVLSVIKIISRNLYRHLLHIWHAKLLPCIVSLNPPITHACLNFLGLL